MTQQAQAEAPQAMSTQEMLAAVQGAYEMFAAIQQFPGRRYMVSTERSNMLKVHLELKRRAALEKAS